MLAPDLLPRKSFETALGSDIHNRIFAATVEILVESGFSQACTNHIAQRAGVSVGSIYRFYPNKHAIYIAISERYLEGFNNIVLEVVGVECGTKSWGDAVDEFVERCAIFYQQNAALARAWNVLLGNPETREAEARLGDQANSMWEKFLFESKLGFSRAECRKISVMIFWGITSLLELSARDDTGINRELVDETKFFVKAYLGAVLAAKESGGEPA